MATVGQLIRAVVITVAIVLGVSSPAPPTVFLSLSSPGELLLLTISTDKGPLTIARSYNGAAWEPLSNIRTKLLNIFCTSSNCSLSSPGNYTILSTSIPRTSPAQLWARLFSQATFGMSKRDLKAAIVTYGTDVGRWIQDQMALPATLHRVYFRQRTNPRSYAAFETPRGNVFQPCEVGSRWHTYAFDQTDLGQYVTVNQVAPMQYKMTLNGVTLLVNTTFISYNTFPVSIYICSVVEQLGGKVGFDLNWANCRYSFLNSLFTLTSIDPSTTLSLSPTEAQFTYLSNVNDRTDIVILTQISQTCSANIDYFVYKSKYYRYDPRLKLLTNTLESPLKTPVYPSVGCPAVPVSVINQKSCQRFDSCSPAQYSAAVVTLNDTTLRLWYTQNNIFVYYLLGLRLEYHFAHYVSPCSGTSRWLRMGTRPCLNATSLDATTLKTIITALNSSTDNNPYIRDIKLNGANCSATTATIGMQVHTGLECFQHVHPDLYSVRDFSQWVMFHPGNDISYSRHVPLPIAISAQNGYTYLTYLASHDMGRWDRYSSFIPVIGRYGDTVSFSSLPKFLQTPALAAAVGSVGTVTDGMQICGSTGEVANDPTLGHRYMFPEPWTGTIITNEMVEWPGYVYGPAEGKSIVWENVILKANDQLRQRVAWTLSEVVVISSLARNELIQTESNFQFYDIFLRNAFGNYLDILREVSYSPMMGNYLTFIQNKGLGVSGNYPDENYAREIMQLFSIGLFELNNDYTHVLDSNGNPIATYTNEDIMDYARVWTGLNYQPLRGNTEQPLGYFPYNYLDPMQIVGSWRDVLPKSKLLNTGYLGDTYPLCDSLPTNHWLTQGATWVYSGSTSIEGSVLDTGSPTAGGYRPRFSPSPLSSTLYQYLCQPDSTRACTFPKSVVLTQNLPCNGVECSASNVISAKIVDVTNNVTRYYTYVSVPCVRLTFYKQGQITGYNPNKQCTNPISTVAYPTCCNPTSRSQISTNPTVSLFANEAVNYNTAIQRCTASGYKLCTDPSKISATWTSTAAQSVYMWVNATCTLKVQVFSNGRVAVYDPLSSFTVLKLNTSNTFRVIWNRGGYPTAPNCGDNCTVVRNTQGPTCLCPLSVVESAVYTNSNYLPSQQELLSTLFIGAAVPQSFGNGVYVQCTSGSCASRNDVKVWNLAGQTSWDITTIFELPPQYLGGNKLYLLNKQSTVYVNSYSFRNPPHFMQYTGEQASTSLSLTTQVRQSQLEIEALLQHIFLHKNTAPFISYRLIQHMVTSNPSPRYVDAVATAFRTGSYKDKTFSGVYGDLGAAVTALLLDPEARSPILEVDPTFGMFREPLMKLMHFLRSMEYTTIDGREAVMSHLYSRIGMEQYNSPSVFSFYPPDNQLSGVLTDMGLVAPEAQLAVPPYIVSFMNGMASLINYGISSCNNGFGYSCTPINGYIQYTPDAGMTPIDIIEELNLLLTSGRLNSATKQFIVDKYITELTTTRSNSSALKLAQKYMVSTAEFHTTGANVLTNQPRPPPPPKVAKNRPFKALVVIFLLGGCDSFSVLIPYANCSTTNLNVAYKNVRGTAAIQQPLPINVPPGTQPCDTFAVHPSLPTVKALYDAKDLAFYANIGALVEPTTKRDYLGTAPIKIALPPSLFAHNQMQRSAQSLDPVNLLALGVIARAVNALESQSSPYATNVYGLTGQLPIMNGVPGPYFVNPSSGVVSFSDLKQGKQMAAGFSNITGYTSSTPFAESFLGIFNRSIQETTDLARQIGNTTLSTTFQKDSLSQQLLQVAKLIKLRNSLQTERGIFVTTIGGFDTHGTHDLSNIFSPIENSLKSFSNEMVAQGMWNDVTVVTLSEFGRTLTSNGAGTDHGWGGNHFITGGSVKGGQILGHFPDVLTDDGPLSVGRGRMIPTTGWEGMWQGVLQWIGVDDSQMDYVLPNMKKFPASSLYDQTEVYN